VNAAPSATIRRLARFGLTTAAADRLADFYQRALGCHRLAEERLSGSDFERSTGVEGGAGSLILGLGAQRVELLQFDRPGRPYPHGAASSDLVFQHFAIVVADMARAYERLASIGGWTAISTGGPVRLPQSSGGVIAFKFRDPEGHPLELLAFPEGAAPPVWARGHGAGLFLGIDHSAISVADSARSIAFYENLGLRVSARSLNQGPGQARLDDIARPVVEVTALAAPQATPHLELLCYRPATGGSGSRLELNDVAATRLVFEADHFGRQAMIDPDGHHLLIVAPGD